MKYFAVFVFSLHTFQVFTSNVNGTKPNETIPLDSEKVASLSVWNNFIALGSDKIYLMDMDHNKIYTREIEHSQVHWYNMIL